MMNNFCCDGNNGGLWTLMILLVLCCGGGCLDGILDKLCRCECLIPLILVWCCLGANEGRGIGTGGCCK